MAAKDVAYLHQVLEQTNLASGMKEEELVKLGIKVSDGYELDYKSKEPWEQQIDTWVRLAAQIKEEKNYPWPKASNIKYPLLATAAMQFAARAYPSLVPADGKIVQFRVVGADPDGQKAMKAERLAKHMNYQILEDMEDWEEEMDRLLIMLPVVGCVFKKTYFDDIKKCNVSKLIGPKDLVVNYWASSLEAAYRKTEIIMMTKNEIKAKQNAGMYLDVDLPDPQKPDTARTPDASGNHPPSQVDESTPYAILEQHTFEDLDDDGYAEPYIITIEKQSKKVLRVVARFDSDGIQSTDDGKLICIQPVEYYTKYGFIPNPDGGFYDVGFGHLLGPLNESANTVINQLIDSGSLSILQAGFIGKGLRIKMGTTKFAPGEWKEVNATGDDLKKQILPLRVAGPSGELIKLLEMLIQSGKELASVAEIFTGKMPGQNTPATTTQASIEQGMKVFTAIYKRTYRSLAKEFKKLFRLNGLYEENFKREQEILDEPVSKDDYDLKNYDVCPNADPTAGSTTEKMMKVQQLGQLIPLGTINIMEFTKRTLEAQEQPNIAALMQQPQPQVDPKVQAVQAKAQMDKEKHQMDMEGKQLDMKMKVIEQMMDRKHEEQMNAMKMQFEELKLHMEAQHQQRQAVLDAATARQEMATNAQEHRQTMQMGEEKHQLSLKQMKEKASAQRNARAMGGMEKSSSNSTKKSPAKGKD